MPGDEQVRSGLILRSAPWDAVDSEYEKRIPFDSPHETADLLQRMVREGTAAHHRIERDGQRIGLLVTRIDEGNQGRELVVIAALCESREPLSDTLAEACEALARAEQCVSIRFHTARAGLARVACRSLGYRITEIVLRKNLS